MKLTFLFNRFRLLSIASIFLFSSFLPGWGIISQDGSWNFNSGSILPEGKGEENLPLVSNLEIQADNLPAEVQQAIDTFVNREVELSQRAEAGEELRNFANEYSNELEVLSAIVDAFGQVFNSGDEADRLRMLSNDSLYEIASFIDSAQIAVQIMDIFLDEFINLFSPLFRDSLYKIVSRLNGILPLDYRRDVLIENLARLASDFYCCKYLGDFRNDNFKHYSRALAVLSKSAINSESKEYVIGKLNLDTNQARIFRDFGVLPITYLMVNVYEPKALREIYHYLENLPFQIVQAVDWILVHQNGIDIETMGLGFPNGFVARYVPKGKVRSPFQLSFNSILFHETGHVVYHKVLSKEERAQYQQLYFESERAVDFARDYGRKNVNEDFATLFEAWGGNSLNLAKQAIEQERNILLRKMVLLLNYFAFQEGGREYVYIYSRDRNKDIERDKRLIIRDVSSNKIIGLDRNGDGEIRNVDSDGDGVIDLFEIFGSRLD